MSLSSCFSLSQYYYFGVCLFHVCVFTCTRSSSFRGRVGHQVKVETETKGQPWSLQDSKSRSLLCAVPCSLLRAWASAWEWELEWHELGSRWAMTHKWTAEHRADSVRGGGCHRPGFYLWVSVFLSWKMRILLSNYHACPKEERWRCKVPSAVSGTC